MQLYSKVAGDVIGWASVKLLMWGILFMCCQIGIYRGVAISSTIRTCNAVCCPERVMIRTVASGR